ncbi:IS1182 family transposase [Actinospica robiniae]|uniref:IS1182 family transposase n=1 Tax=Actinospica robiniae TaxID=304901 RepID=UPI000559607F|nr:IS1182 family transposase [Actinospica robiniae]
MRVRDALGPLFADEDFEHERFAGMFAALGRPALSPGLLAMVTVLQFLHNLSDREAVVAMADRISWKYALGLDVAETGFDASVLAEFRARLAEPGRADALLDTVLDKLKAAGLVRAGGRARTDSTHVLAAVRSLGRVEMLGESVRAALEEIARVAPERVVPLLAPGWEERYGRKVETSRLIGRGRGKATMEELAGRFGADGSLLLETLKADPTAGWVLRLPQVRLLAQVWEQHFERSEGGGWVLKAVTDLPPAAELPISPYDPDARYAVKRASGWEGGKVHLTESCDEDLPHLVTDVATSAATVQDSAQTTDIQERLLARGLGPGVHVMDAGYPTAANLIAAAGHGITLIAPVTVSSGRGAKTGTFSPGEFEIDWDTGRARCPGEKVSNPMRGQKNGLVAFSFSRRDCTPCPLRTACLSAPAPRPRVLVVHPREPYEARMNAIRTQHTPEWQKVYNQRAGIEGTISQAVRISDLRHSRYRGLPKNHLQNVLTGIAINIRRLGAHYAPTQTKPRRPTRIQALYDTHHIGKPA